MHHHRPKMALRGAANPGVGVDRQREQMSEKLPSDWFLWLGLGVVVVGVLVALLPSAKSLVNKPITVSLDTNGTAWLGGVPLPPKIRHSTFSALATVGVRARFSLPVVWANSASADKGADTIKSMYRARLIAANQN